MRKLWLVGSLILMVGCQNIVGPFRPRSPQRIDDPSLSIQEQERRGRERLALPDQSPFAGPNAGLNRPDR
jgi:hypothetical protein